MDRSIPETVMQTLLAYQGDKLIGCEGKEIPVHSKDFIGWDYCKKCPIVQYCWFRYQYLFTGGEI